MPSESILGIILAPDRKQVLKTNAVISEALSRIDRIKQENEQAKPDWGSVEQNPCDRLRKGST
jgi:ABC-type phosphonate transport system ATPase subunit